jgi:hypothetical protein
VKWKRERNLRKESTFLRKKSDFIFYALNVRWTWVWVMKVMRIFLWWIFDEFAFSKKISFDIFYSNFLIQFPLLIIAICIQEKSQFCKITSNPRLENLKISMTLMALLHHMGLQKKSVYLPLYLAKQPKFFIVFRPSSNHHFIHIL